MPQLSHCGYAHARQCLSLFLHLSKTSFIFVIGAQPLSVLPGQLFADTTASLESCSSSPGRTGVLPIIQSHLNKASNRSDILYSRESLHGDEHGLVIHWILYWPQGHNTVYPSAMTDTLLAARAQLPNSVENEIFAGRKGTGLNSTSLRECCE